MCRKKPMVSVYQSASARKCPEYNARADVASSCLKPRRPARMARLGRPKYRVIIWREKEACARSERSPTPSRRWHIESRARPEIFAWPIHFHHHLVAASSMKIMKARRSASAMTARISKAASNNGSGAAACYHRREETYHSQLSRVRREGEA